MKRRKITRRDLLKGTGTILLGTLVGRCAIAGTQPASRAADPSLTPRAYLPLTKNDGPTPTPTLAPGTARVVHVHDPDATNWSGSGWYGSAVSQSIVDDMIKVGLQNVTGKSTWADIWRALFSQVKPAGYQVGQKIAIKVNFNNSGANGGCTGTGNRIDALPHPVKALIAGLVGASVHQEDIWVYDATVVGRTIPDRFRNPILSSYPNVRFYGKDDCAGVYLVSHGGHSSLTVQFADPQGYLNDRKLADVLYDATYLINMPILKAHGIHPASLGFKNHFGSINSIIRGGNDNLHIFINPSESLYRSDYSPLVDIFRNTNIADKIILTIGDALYGAYGATAVPPTSWNTFDDAPNSFLLSTDPVAIDCCMTDLLVAEGWVNNDAAYDYLFVAQSAGLGVCEGTRQDPGGDPWRTPYGSGYSKIQYVRIDR